MKIAVHTLRIGHIWWMQACAPSLEDWCEAHGHMLTIWRGRDIPRGYPHPKFCQIDMLRSFLKSDATHFFYVDADVYVNPEAPPHPRIPGPGLIAMPDLPTRISRTWPRWARARHPGFRLRAGEWVYRNAGIWFCDRSAAEAILKHAVPPFFSGCMDQNDWNYWMAMASTKEGMPVHDLPVRWNAYNYHRGNAHFYHLAGKNKVKKYRQRVSQGQIPPNLLSLIPNSES